MHKIHVATKEARESLYWLRLLAEAEIVPAAKLAALTQETDEIIAILVPIARSTSRPAEP